MERQNEAERWMHMVKGFMDVKELGKKGYLKLEDFLDHIQGEKTKENMS